VLAASDLKRLFSADTQGIEKAPLRRVAWANDGTVLAGGAYHDAHGVSVVRWPQGGKRGRAALPAGHNTIMSIVPLAGGGFVYASADPAFGRYTAQHWRVIERWPEMLDFAAISSGFPRMARRSALASNHPDGGRQSRRRRCGAYRSPIGTVPLPSSPERR
jgi:hypothetical protein